MKNENCRFYIKTQYRLGKQTIEILYDLKTFYNATVAHLTALFKNGRESIEDDSRHGYGLCERVPLIHMCCMKVFW